MVNPKKKGNAGENEFSHWLQENGIKASRNPMSGGSIWKGDINNPLDMCFEIKTVKRINLQEAWKQVKRDSGMAMNVPVLAIHFDNMPDQKWLIIQDCDDWLEAIKSKKVEPQETTGGKRLRWDLENLKNAVSKVLSSLDK